MKSCDIAFLLGYPEISGGTNVILEHAVGLTRLGHKVSIVTEVPFDRSRLSWKPDAMNLPLLCHADCRDRTFDVAIATWWRSAYDIPFIKSRHYAYFVQSIESRFFPPEQPDMKALAEYSYRMPMPVVTEATWIKKYLEGHYGRTSTLVLNGIDKKTFSLTGPVTQPRPASGLRVLVEGPLGVEFKRTDLALDLCRQAGMTDVWLLTSSECQSHPNADRVFSKIPVTRVGDIYRSCDVLVKLSTVEGMFGPPLEMFHCGGTAITSDVTGHDEYMKHGKNGIVVRRGNEPEVVTYLRSLSTDRRFLSSLQQGAIATAEAWPDWPASSRNFSEFILNLVDSPTIDRATTEAMLMSLHGALRLAGPLHDLLRREISGREALRRVQQKATEKLVGTVPALKPILSPQANEAKPPRPPAVQLPQVRRSLALTPRPTFRAAFLLPSRGARWHAPSIDGQIQPLVIALDGPPSRRDLASVAAFRPDVTFVLNPDQLARRDIEALPGIVIGHVSAPLNTAELEHLRELFPATDERCGVLHIDQREVPLLATNRIRALGSLLLPIDFAAFRSSDGFEQWRQRPISLAYFGKPTRATGPILNDLAKIPGFIRIDPDIDDATLRGLLAQTRCTIHMHDPQVLPPTAQLALRDMSMGCLVIAQSFRVDYSLMGGEHYVHFRDLPEAVHIARRSVEILDHQDVVRAVGRSRAAEFGADQMFYECIVRHCCPVGTPTSEVVA